MKGRMLSVSEEGEGEGGKRQESEGKESVE